MKDFFGNLKKEFTPAKIVAVLLIGLLLLPLLLKFARPYLRKIPVVGDAVGGAALLLLTLALSFGSANSAFAFDASGHSAPSVVAAVSSLPAVDVPFLAPMLATAPTAALYVPIAAGVFVVACLLVALRKWLKSNLIPIAGLSILLFVLTVNAAVRIGDEFTAIILKPSRTSAESDTNYFRLFSGNGSNSTGIDTNCRPVLFGGSGWMTGVTASLVCTQAGGIVCTARFVNGLLVTTNGSLPTF